MVRALATFVALLSLSAVAKPPKAVADLAAAIDGAKRAIDNKECTFAVEEPACDLPVKVSCSTPSFKYSYVMTIPLKKVEPKNSSVQQNAGGFRGAHGVELSTTGDVIVTVTDANQRTTGSIVNLAFGTTEDDLKRAKKVVGALNAARAACR